MTQLVDFVRLFSRDRRGVSSVEYALMLALVAGGMVVAAIALGNAVSGEIDEATNCVTDSVCN